MTESKGLILVLLTALVSGLAIFLNSFAVKGFNPFAFTFMKNAVVAVFLLSLILILKEFQEIKKLSFGQWKQLVAVGLVGGSIPFLLFFYALKLATPTAAGFIHKSLFIWATIFAFIFLKEKVSKQFIAAALMLFAGNFIFFGPITLGFPELLVFAATLLWAAENVLSKHVLKQTIGRIVAFGRMFFGSAFILLFLVATNQLNVLQVSLPQAQWVLLTSVLLFLFVFTYYSGLKHLSVQKATAILLLGQPITALLSIAFLGKVFSLQQAIGLTLIVFGVFVAIGFSHIFTTIKRRAVIFAGNKY
tara:strand:- start:58 stop:969 length:912 start_codon:yes stop_codon:yes gene_type:complete